MCVGGKGAKVVATHLLGTPSTSGPLALEEGCHLSHPGVQSPQMAQHIACAQMSERMGDNCYE